MAIPAISEFVRRWATELDASWKATSAKHASKPRGMFNSTWGNYPAAVSWQTASQQAREDVVSSASGTAG